MHDVKGRASGDSAGEDLLTGRSDSSTQAPAHASTQGSTQASTQALASAGPASALASAGSERPLPELAHGPILHVVLLEPEIPQNTGSVGRLCVGTGCRLHLVKPLGFSIDEKAVRRAGLDYWRFVDLRVHENFDSVLQALAGHRFCFTSARHGQPYTRHPFERGDVVVFGRESVGLPPVLHERYTEQFIHIPCPGPIRSLNLSNAVSVVVYEGMRQLQPDLF